MNMSLSTVGERLLPPPLDHQPADFWAAIRAGHWPENYEKPGSRLKSVIRTLGELLEIAESRSQTFVGRYLGAWEYLPLACSCGEPITRTVMSTFRQTHVLCQTCSIERKRLVQEAKVKARCAKRGETLLSPYVDGKTKHIIKCGCDNIYRIDPNKHRIGRGCRKCAGNCPETSAKDYYALIEQTGWRTSPYEGTGKNITAWCPKDHPNSIRPSNFKTGHRCGECYREENRREDRIYCTTFGDVRHRLRLLQQCAHDELPTADELRVLARDLGLYDSIMDGFKKSLIGGVQEDLDHAIPIAWLSFSPARHLTAWQKENMVVVAAEYNNRKLNRLAQDVLVQIAYNPVMRGIWDLCDNAPPQVRSVVEAFLVADMYEQVAILESAIWDKHGMLKKEKRLRFFGVVNRKEIKPMKHPGN